MRSVEGEGGRGWGGGGRLRSADAEGRKKLGEEGEDLRVLERREGVYGGSGARRRDGLPRELPSVARAPPLDRIADARLPRQLLVAWW